MKTPRKVGAVPARSPRPKPPKGHDFEPDQKNGPQPADTTPVASPSTSGSGS